MSQRSDGVFPREKFDLDTEMLLTTTPVESPVQLSSVNTWKAVVIGAGNLGEGGEGGYLKVNVGNRSVDFYSEDLDANGVGLAYIRGSSIGEGETDVYYEEFNGAIADFVYLDAVDNLG